MGTIEIHEPEVKKSNRQVVRSGGSAPERSGPGAQAFAPRMMFSDSLLEFGPQQKTQAVRHDHVVHLELPGNRHSCWRFR